MTRLLLPRARQISSGARNDERARQRKRNYNSASENIDGPGMCGPEQTPELQWVSIRELTSNRLHSGSSFRAVDSCAHTDHRPLPAVFMAHFIAVIAS